MAPIANLPTLGGTFGTSVGQGVGNALQQLLGRKLEQMQLSSGLKSMGVPQDKIEGFKKLPPQFRDPLIQNYLQSDQYAQDRSNSLNALTQPQQSEQIDLKVLKDILDKQQTMQAETKTQPDQAITPTGQPIMPQQGVQLPGQNMLNQVLGQTQRSPFAKALTEGEKLKAASMVQKEQQFKEKTSLKEQHDIDMESKKYYEKINEDYRGLAVAGKWRLGRMDTLVKEGKLDSASFSSLLDGIEKATFGAANLDFLRSPASQEFKKLSMEYLKDARSLFGSKITQSEIQMFMKSIPTLNLTSEGKLRVMKNMKIYNTASELRKNTMDQLMKENGGRRPRNMESLIEDRVKPAMDKLGDEFNKTLSGTDEGGLGDSVKKLYNDYLDVKFWPGQ